MNFWAIQTVGWIHFKLGGEEGLREGIKKPPRDPEWQHFVPDLCQTIPKATESTTGTEQLLTEGLILNTKKGKKERQPLRELIVNLLQSSRLTLRFITLKQHKIFTTVIKIQVNNLLIMLTNYAY